MENTDRLNHLVVGIVRGQGRRLMHHFLSSETLKSFVSVRSSPGGLMIGWEGSGLIVKDSDWTSASKEIVLAKYWVMAVTVLGRTGGAGMEIACASRGKLGWSKNPIPETMHGTTA